MGKSFVSTNVKINGAKLSFFAALFFSSPMWAQSESVPHVWADLPILEMPFNQESGFPTFFSMRQSLAYSNSFYQGMHRWIAGEDLETAEDRRRIFAIAGFDLVTSYVPLGSSWLHEEWHRSVMTRRKIGSFNDVNKFPFGAELIAVSHVEDADLVRLKRDHPAEQVRLSSAGMESQVVQNLTIEKKHFYDDAKSFDGILLWLNAVNVSSYLSTCSSPDADKSTDKQNREDGMDLLKRDFTGLDCTAWVYDLFRPEEPYLARGNHPSGVGIDRYIRYSDLNDKEKSFLQMQTKYSLFNFVDPFLFGRKGFDGEIGGQKFRWNLKMSHSLTSFGGVVDTILFVKTEEQKFLFTWHHGMTDTRYMPGVSFEWIDMALPWDRYSLTSQFTVWQQPRDQRVESTDVETLVDASTQFSYDLNSRWKAYVGLEGKTPGWIAGNVYLDRNASVWTGVKAGLF